MRSCSIWQKVLINKSNRPVFDQGEHNVYIREGVGLYHGRQKIKDYQNGRLYLTNKRVIWLDVYDQQAPVALSLADVALSEHVEGFLRSSPKVKVFLKRAAKSGQSTAETGTPRQQSQFGPTDSTLRLPILDITSVDWACIICLYNNQIELNTDLNGPLPACVSCGIQPSKAQLEKLFSETDNLSRGLTLTGAETSPDACPKCTFINHSSMRFCELCGTALRLVLSSLIKKLQSLDNASSTSLESENPLGPVSSDKEEDPSELTYVKFSFRKGGDLEFFRHLKEEVQALQWLALEAKGAINGDALKLNASRDPSPQKDLPGGIRGLEKLDELKRKQNEDVLSLSLEDFKQLMKKAQDILNLVDSFQTVLKPQRILLTKHDTIIPQLNVNKSSRLYHQELARHISEFLLNFELTSVTSMVTLPALFASYNRFLILSQGFGCELVLPQDMKKGLEYLQKLRLPVRLKTYLSGLVVVARQSHDLQDLQRLIMKFLADDENAFKYQKFCSELLVDNDSYMRDKYRAFHGLTVSQIADHYGWSPAVCTEELQRCVAALTVVVDEHILGVFYFINAFDPDIAAFLEDEESLKKRAHKDVLEKQKLISSTLKNTHEAYQSLVCVSDFDFGSAPEERPPQLSKSVLSAPSALSESLNQLSGLNFT